LWLRRTLDRTKSTMPTDCGIHLHQWRQQRIATLGKQCCRRPAATPPVSGSG
jgi:hypothetical protein